MGYELDKVMKQYGVGSFALPTYSGSKAPSETAIPNTDTKAPVKYYTAPVAPTMPVMPTAPTAFTGVAPTAPIKLGKKATADQKAAYDIENAKYLADLNTFTANKNAAEKAAKDYSAALTVYPNLMKTYNTDLAKFNTDKTTWDELQRKYDLDQKSYNDYVSDYKARMAGTPQYLGNQFVQGKTVTQSRPNTSMGQTSVPVADENSFQFIPQGVSQTPADINAWVKNNPYATNQDVQNYQKTNNLTNKDLYNATGNYYGNTLSAPTYGNLSTNFNNLSPQQQASNYAQQRNLGYTDADIKSKFAKQFGSPTDANWTAMQNLAFPTTMPSTNTTGLNTITNTNTNVATPFDENNLWSYDEYGNPVEQNQYARGGSVHNLARKYAVGGGIVADVMPNPEEGIPQPQEQLPVQSAPQQDNRMAQLQSMMEKYGNPQNDYAQELEEARRKSNAETEAFVEMLKNSRKSPGRDNISQAERYFRLAAAFGQPTKTGSFGETLANVNTAMAENEKSKQQAEDQDLELQLKAQQLKAAGAKEDLSTLRSLSSEDKKTQREMLSNMIKAEIESGKPQSELAKIAKDRYGYGTPDYYSFLEKNVPAWVESKMAQMQMGPVIAAQAAANSGKQANIAEERLAHEIKKDEENEKQMSPQEFKEKTDLQNQINTLENATSTIERAYKLNANSFGNTPIDKLKRKELELTVGDKDPKVKNTRELETFLGTTVLDLAQDLKGSISDSDTKMLQNMTGAQALGADERADVLHKNWSVLQKNLDLKKKQLNDIIGKRAKLYNPGE